MSSSVSLLGANMYYRINHPEFDPKNAYMAIAYIDYGESAWGYLLFVNERGMTYSVKQWRCMCVICVCLGQGRLKSLYDGVLWFPLSADLYPDKLPWPKPRCKNPDLENFDFPET